MKPKVDIRPDGVALIHPSGRLDLLTAAELRQQLQQRVAEGNRLLVVDLGDVSFTDSSGLGMLISGLKVARLAGGDLRLARANDQVKLILKLTSLDRVLRTYPTIEEALEGRERVVNGSPDIIGQKQ